MLNYTIELTYENLVRETKNLVLLVEHPWLKSFHNLSFQMAFI
jgi:hypothetical protein